MLFCNVYVFFFLKVFFFYLFCVLRSLRQIDNCQVSILVKKVFIIIIIIIIINELGLMLLLPLFL